MKKIFALALALALALSLASVAFAVDTEYAIDSVSDAAYKVPSKKTYVGDTMATSFAYGNTIYYPLFGKDFVDDVEVADGFVVKSDAVQGVKISAEWDVGEEWVSKVEIVKKRFGDGGPYIYFLAVSFKSAPTKAAAADVVGEIVLKKTSGDNEIDRDALYTEDGGETPELAIDLTLEYGAGASDGLITDSSKKFTFGDGEDYTSEEDEEFEFTFDKWVDATFTVNTYGQNDIVLKATTDYNADVGALYPDANLDFYNGNGAVFNKTGTMYIPAEEGSFIYEVKGGVLVEIAGATYDEYDEGFYFKTRTLGTYVLSDVELELVAAVPGDVVVPVEEVPAVNPSTGAAA